MNAISSSFNFRSSQGAALPTTQQNQRGNFNTFNSGVGAARGNVNATSMGAVRGGVANSSSSAFCPGCGVGGSAARGGASGSSSFCPTCNVPGGRQSSITNTNFNTPARTGAAQAGAAQAHNHQGGRVCVGCAYQGR